MVMASLGVLAALGITLVGYWMLTRSAA